MLEDTWNLKGAQSEIFLKIWDSFWVIRPYYLLWLHIFHFELFITFISRYLLWDLEIEGRVFISSWKLKSEIQPSVSSGNKVLKAD